MRCLVFAALFCLTVPQFAQQSLPEIKFQAQTDFFKLPPDLYIGEAAGVAVNSKGACVRFLSWQHCGSRLWRGGCPVARV